MRFDAAEFAEVIARKGGADRRPDPVSVSVCDSLVEVAQYFSAGCVVAVLRRGLWHRARDRVSEREIPRAKRARSAVDGSDAIPGPRFVGDRRERVRGEPQACRTGHERCDAVQVEAFAPRLGEELRIGVVEPVRGRCGCALQAVNVGRRRRRGEVVGARGVGLSPPQRVDATFDIVTAGLRPKKRS